MEHSAGKPQSSTRTNKIPEISVIRLLYITSFDLVPIYTPTPCPASCPHHVLRNLKSEEVSMLGEAGSSQSATWEAFSKISEFSALFCGH